MQNSESAFNDSVKEIKLQFKEFKSFISITQQRIDIENEYCKKLQELEASQTNQPHGNSNNNNSLLSVFWKLLKKNTTQICLGHQNFSLQLSKLVKDELSKELDFQKAKVSRICDDLYQSFDDYNTHKNKLKNLEETCTGRHSFEEETTTASTTTDDINPYKEEQPLILEKEYRECAVRLEIENYNELIKTIDNDYETFSQFSSTHSLEQLEQAWQQKMILPPQIIYKDINDGALPDLTFGVNLVDHLCILELPLPLFLSKAVAQIEARGLNSRNLYLKAFNFDQARSLCNIYEKNSSKFPWESLELDNVELMIKKYFLDLPEPVFPFIIHKHLEFISNTPREDVRLALLTNIIKDLPLEHFKIH